MARTDGGGQDRAAGCSCLPEVIPDGSRRFLDGAGGLEGLTGMLPDEGELARAVTLHKAMSDPLRLKALSLLELSPLCVCVIRATLGVEDSKLSYHLGVLKEAGLVEARKEGSWIIYSLSENGRAWLRACKR